MNLPNQLTVGRLVLTVIFVAVMSLDFAGSRSLALILFVAASITDFLDGHIARSRNLVTRFGKLMDPVADKILMCAGLVFLTADPMTRDLLRAWIVVTILAREFLVTGLRLIASAEGEVLAAEKLGKHKTIWQMITVIYLLVYLASPEPMFRWSSFVFQWKPTSPEVAGRVLIWITLILTVVSGCGYLWKNRGILRAN